MQQAAHFHADILKENEELRVRLEEAEDMLRAIRSGDVDALVVESDAGPQVYTLQGQDAEASRLRGEMLEQVSDAVIAVNESGLVTFLNAAAERLYGLAASKARARPLADIFSTRWLRPDDETAAAAALREHGEWHGETVHVRHDGRELHVESSITALRGKDGQETGRLAVIRDVSQRRQHEKRVLVSEVRYRRLFEAAHDGVLILDPATRKIIEANPFMTTLLGYRHDQLIGMELYEIGFLADAQASRDMFQALKTTRQVRYENLPLRNQQGGLRDVEVVANFYDEDGRSVVQCNVRDITERRKVETELRERRNFLDGIFEVLPGVLYIFDLDENRVVFSSKSGVERAYSSEEIAAMGGDFVRNLMHADDQPRFQEYIACIQMLDPGAMATFEYRMKDKAGEWHWYLNTDTVFLRDEGGVARQFIGVALEITDRKRAELALRESEARQHQVLEASRIGTFDVDLVSGETIWNPTEFELLGLQPGEAPPSPETFFRHVHPEDLVGAKASWETALQNGTFNAEFRIIRADGEIRFLTGRGNVSYDQTDDNPRRARRYLGVNFDITERKRQEEHVKLLMGEVNHRSKNLLTVVQAIAKKTIATQPEDFIERFGQRVQALAANQDLLVKSEWKAVPLGDLVRSQLAHFGDVRDTRFALDGPPVGITASASQAVGMALHELATNAAKYGAWSNQVGRVAISWRLRSDAGGKERFTMSWTESGGPTVAKPTRHGFGSTVIGTMIKMSLGCDGEIDFAPTGLVWRIDCPAAGLIEGSALSAPQSNGAAPKEQPAKASGRRRVLVVEDEPLIAMDIAHTLAEAGYDVIGPANSVAEALALLARSGCDAAVLDINLGAETAEPVARELIKRGTPFIATSGYTREQQPEILRTAPLLGKPVKPGLLIAEIGGLWAADSAS